MRRDRRNRDARASGRKRCVENAGTPTVTAQRRRRRRDRFDQGCSRRSEVGPARRFVPLAGWITKGDSSRTKLDLEFAEFPAARTDRIDRDTERGWVARATPLRNAPLQAGTGACHLVDIARAADRIDSEQICSAVVVNLKRVLSSCTDQNIRDSVAIHVSSSRDAPAEVAEPGAKAQPPPGAVIRYAGETSEENICPPNVARTATISKGRSDYDV